MSQLSFEDLVLQGIEAREQHEKSQWQLGDLALRVDTHYGEHTLKDYAARIGIEYETLRQYRRVAGAYENGMRIPNLSFYHHQQIASRPDRLEWLEKAAEQRWSARQMVTEIEWAEAQESEEEYEEEHHPPDTGQGQYSNGHRNTIVDGALRFIDDEEYEEGESDEPELEGGSENASTPLSREARPEVDSSEAPKAPKQESGPSQYDKSVAKLMAWGENYGEIEDFARVAKEIRDIARVHRTRCSYKDWVRKSTPKMDQLLLIRDGLKVKIQDVDAAIAYLEEVKEYLSEKGEPYPERMKAVSYKGAKCDTFLYAQFAAFSVKKPGLCKCQGVIDGHSS